jgi:glutamine phosphoribosylpyrophosphate amidotransferase
VYQTFKGLVEAVRGPDHDRRFCAACFNGEYPTGLTRRDLAAMERERSQWMC